MAEVEHWSARRCSAPGRHLTLGEGPVWDASSGRLRWVDIAAGTVFEGTLEGDALAVVTQREFGETVGAVLLARDGGLVVAGARSIHLIDVDGALVGSVPLLDPDVSSRLNDGICDSAGRLLVGSLPLDDRRGSESVYRLDPDGTVTTLLSGLTLANGMGFSPDDSELFLVDSVPGLVHAYEYDLADGSVGERRTVWQEDGMVPDGLTVDAEGMLWVAFFGAGAVLRLSPDGDVVGRVSVPAPNTTCPAFVGPDLDRLVITTAREQLSDDQLAQWPDSGAVFVAEPWVRGLPVAGWAGSTMRKTVG